VRKLTRNSTLRDTASLRANWRSVTNWALMLRSRCIWIMLRMEGAAITAMTAITATTIISSIKVKP
jgi:hypothetical protein